MCRASSVFVFKQKTAYEMRISDWSSDVCSSDLEPVQLAQDFRTFDFMSPWEGAEYILPGDEKAAVPEAKGAPSPVPADKVQKADAAAAKQATPKARTHKPTASPAQNGQRKAEHKPTPKPQPTKASAQKKPG